MASRIPSIAETGRDPGFPLAGLHISLLPAARVIVTEVSQLASDNRGGESVGFARRTWGVTPWGLRLHVVFEQDQQVTDGGRVELAGGDLDRHGGDGSPAMSGLGRLVLGSVVWLWAPDTVSARPFRVDPVRWRWGATGYRWRRRTLPRAVVRGCLLASSPGAVAGTAQRARVCGGVRWRPGRVPLRWAGSPASRGGRRADGRLLGSAPSTRQPVADRQHAEGPRLSAGDEPPASKGPLGDADRGQVEEAPK